MRRNIPATNPAAVIAAIITFVRSATGSTRTPSGEAITTATGLESVRPPPPPPAPPPSPVPSFPGGDSSSLEITFSVTHYLRQTPSTTRFSEVGIIFISPTSIGCPYTLSTLADSIKVCIVELTSSNVW